MTRDISAMPKDPADIRALSDEDLKQRLELLQAAREEACTLQHQANQNLTPFTNESVRRQEERERARRITKTKLFAVIQQQYDYEEHPDGGWEMISAPIPILQKEETAEYLNVGEIYVCERWIHLMLGVNLGSVAREILYPKGQKEILVYSYNDELSFHRITLFSTLKEAEDFIRSETSDQSPEDAKLTA